MHTCTSTTQQQQSTTMLLLRAQILSVVDPSLNLKQTKMMLFEVIIFEENLDMSNCIFLRSKSDIFQTQQSISSYVWKNLKILNL